MLIWEQFAQPVVRRKPTTACTSGHKAGIDLGTGAVTYVCDAGCWRLVVN
jgi:hypothetical protein